MTGPLKALQKWASGGSERAVARPYIAGYRRAVAPGWVLAGLVVLAGACFAYGFYFSVMAPARMMPFAVAPALLGMLLIWGLPQGAYAPTRTLEPLYIGFFASLILWPNYLAVALPGLPWMTMLRLFVIPLSIAFLICISVSKAFRAKIWDVLTADKTLWRLMVIFLVVQTICIPLSRDPGTSINRFIISQTNWTLIFLVGVVVFLRRGFAEYWSTLLLMMLSCLCFIGIWEWRVGHVPWGGHIPSIFRIDDPTVIRILTGAARATTSIYRVQGPSTTPLGFAELLGLAVPFAIHFAMDRYPIVVRILSALYIPLATFVILLTDSRLGLVAELGSFAVYLLIWALIRWQRQKENLLGPAIVLTYPVFFVGMLAATFLIGRIRNEVWGNGAQQASNDGRMLQWASGIPKILSHPQGYGVGMGGTELGFTNAAGVGTIDSYYLSIFLDYGVFGFVVYYGLILYAAWSAGKAVVQNQLERELRLLIPLAVSLVNFVVVKSVLSQDANHPLIFMMLGAVAALLYRANASKPLAAELAAGSTPRSAGQDLGWLPLMSTLLLASAVTYVILMVMR